MKKRIDQLLPGDRVNLEGDIYADPKGERVEFIYEYETVEAIERELLGEAREARRPGPTQRAGLRGGVFRVWLRLWLPARPSCRNRPGGQPMRLTWTFQPSRPVEPGAGPVDVAPGLQPGSQGTGWRSQPVTRVLARHVGRWRLDDEEGAEVASVEKDPFTGLRGPRWTGKIARRLYHERAIPTWVGREGAQATRRAVQDALAAECRWLLDCEPDDLEFFTDTESQMEVSR